MKNRPEISIIIPCLNCENEIGILLSSLDAIGFKSIIEVIIVDNGSSDRTLSIARAFSPISFNLIVLEFTTEKGPGVARDEGVRNASGVWILFLDSDDQLNPEYFHDLESYLLSSNTHQIVVFNWTYQHQTEATGNRTDLGVLRGLAGIQIAERFLKHQIDPSVIFMALRRNFITRLGLYFREGYHEDVDYSFKALCSCRVLGVIDRPIYLKRNRAGSIVNTLTEAHLDGYFGAAKEIKKFLISNDQYTSEFFEYFVTSVAGSRLSRFFRPGMKNEISIDALTEKLMHEVKNLLDLSAWCERTALLPEAKVSRWERVFMNMVQICETPGITSVDLQCRLDEISSSFWSCYDLQNSVFLAPDEIRTCCKRFFYDGEQRGDAVILDNFAATSQNIDLHQVIQAKKTMIKNINTNSEPQCHGCPHLKYEKWGDPLSEGIHYLSLEYHSLCNMRCNYCSDKYWDGRRPFYDVKQVIRSFAKDGMLQQTQYIVWGGGEPTLDKDFDSILCQLGSLQGAPKIRVITNGTIFKPKLAELMRKDQAFIITSFDAGDANKFKIIRGSNHFDKVTKNLQKYIESSSENTVIKYILQDDNSDKATLVAFQRHIQDSCLADANFQISVNFTTETVAERILEAIMILHTLLRDIGVRFIFWDDLVWQRLPSQSHLTIERARQACVTQGIEPRLLLPSAKPVIIAGSGAQAHLVLRKSVLLREVGCSAPFDPRSREFDHFINKQIPAFPHTKYGAKPRIYIAAVQSAPDIARSLVERHGENIEIIQEIVI